MAGEKGFTLWFTGLSGAGKTTISRVLEGHLRERGSKLEILDGDIVRENLSKGLTFSKEDRDTNVRRIAFVANMLARNGVCAVTATISPYRAVRDEGRRRAQTPFIEAFVDVPLEVAEKRDAKGRYKKARAGAIEHFTGITGPYEPPLKPEVGVKTHTEDVEESAARVLAHLAKSKLISP